MAGRILDCISSPADLKLLSDSDLKILAREIREEIITVTSKTGGHVASSLGAVETILAVYSLINAPKDKFIFDVGHQAYAHKIITGRLGQFHTLRQYGGISGFPRPDESPYDVHPSGHASDSISIGVGMAKARQLRGTDEKIVVLIGDASISGGMAFEALNTIGQLQLPMVIILNDNEMSISKNVGALVKHLGQVRASARYRQARDQAQEILEDGGPLGKSFVSLGRNVKESMKQFVVPHTMMFEQLGILCTPPINGHSIPEIKSVLRTALAADGPVLVHLVTRKGAGYGPAERDPERFHGVGPYDIKTGAAVGKPKTVPTYTDVFGKAIVREAERDKRIVAITAAMRDGTGLRPFSEKFPQRFVDVGIAEENAVGMASGLAIGGFKPVVAIYSTFLQRAVDQTIIDASLPKLNVVFAIDRAGVVGADGATHHGLFDISYMRMIPNMRVITPSDEAELTYALHTALELGGPVAIRYPRGSAMGVPVPDEPKMLPLGKGDIRREGTDVAILAFGNMVKPSLEAAERLQDEDGISARVVDMRWAKPIDPDAVSHAAKTRLIITVEDGIIAGGAGEGVVEVMARLGETTPVITLGVNDRFVQHGAVNLLMRDLGLDADGIRASILKKLAELEDSDA